MYSTNVYLPRVPRFYLIPQLPRFYFLGHRNGLRTNSCDFSTFCKIQHFDLKGEKMLLITTRGPLRTNELLLVKDKLDESEKINRPQKCRRVGKATF